MIKQSWNISFEEKLRILNLHESATKKQYLVSEQKIVTKKVEPKTFTLPNSTFPSGKYLEFDRASVDKVLNDMNEYLKNFPQNQQINVEIESSESKVPNRGVGLKSGELSQKRGEELAKYLQGKLPENVKPILKSLGAQGPSWNPPKNATSEQIKALARDPQYTQFQYVKFNIVGSGESQEEICDLGFYVIVDYKREWCKPDVDESRCHKCDKAVFLMWANGILLTNEKGDPNINLNNNEGSGKSGPSREFRLYVSEEQKKRILAVNPEEILITYGCALDDCHSDPAHITIISTNGDVLLPGTFITTGGNRTKKTDPPVKLLKLNKCGEKIAVAGDESMKPEVPKPQVKAFRLTYDTNAQPTVESLYQIYQFVDNGVLKIPQDKLELFRSFKQYNNKPWQNFVDVYELKNKTLKSLYDYAKTKQGQ